MTVDEIVAGIIEHTKDDDPKTKTKAKEIAQALINKAKDVAQLLQNRGAAGKGKEVEKEIAKLTTDLEGMTTERDELQTKLDETAATNPPPDWAERFKEQQKKHDGELGKLRTRAETAEKKAIDESVDRVKDRFFERIRPKIKPIAREMVKAKYDSRFRAKDGKGPVEVLQVDDDSPYTVADKEDAVDLLLADALKQIDPEFILAGGEPGGGTGSGGGGGTGGGKDLVDESVTVFNKQREQQGVNPLIRKQA